MQYCHVAYLVIMVDERKKSRKCVSSCVYERKTARSLHSLEAIGGAVLSTSDVSMIILFFGNKASYRASYLRPHVAHACQRSRLLALTLVGAHD